MSLQSLYEDISNETKKLLKTHISENTNTLKLYKINLKLKYNNYITYVLGVWNTLDNDTKFTLQSQIVKIRDKVRACYLKLKVPLLHTPFILDTINYVDIESDTTNDFYNSNIIGDIHLIFYTMEASTLFKLCSSHINKPYSGDPLGLKSFTDSITLLSSFATTPALRTLLVSFIKTRIDGKARDFVDDSHTTTDDIITALQDNIKCDNSKVIEGRMLSISAFNTSNEDFATKVEELSDAFRRSLIIEGISHIKATEMAIDKTVELCRKNTSNTTVKSVLASSKFTSSKEVVAKLITESNIAKAEHSVLRFGPVNNTRNFRNNSNFNSQRRFPFNRNRYNNNNTRNFQNRNNNRNNGFNNNFNNSSQNNNNNRGGRRFFGRQSNNRGNRNNPNVRFYEPENPSGPQHLQLGAQSAQSAPTTQQ